MTMKELRLQAARLKLKRADADVDQADLRVSLGLFLVRGHAKEFAERIGVTPQYLSDIRNGRRDVSDEFLEKLASL